MGAQSTYTEEKGNKICELMSTGITLAEICRNNEEMPTRQTVYDWIDSSEDFKRRIERAREAGYEAIAEETLRIADDGSNDYMTITRGDESYNVEDREVTSRSKLRVETRLKLLSKWHPKKYGDKIEHSGNVNFTNEPVKFE